MGVSVKQLGLWRGARHIDSLRARRMGAAAKLAGIAPMVQSPGKR
ncbi:MAG TPA: hypothetical protein VIQ74_17595 [Gemmatimonadaceae bacterium]